jgi:hypothetical protein
MFGGMRNSYLGLWLNTKSTGILGLFDRDSRQGYFICGPEGLMYRPNGR